MRPVFVCQLPEELQEEIEGILTRLLLYQCGSAEKAKEYFGESLAEAVQICMESKIVDIDCVADSIKNGGHIDGEVPENIRKDAERLMEIIAQRREMETDNPFLYRTKEQVEEKDYHELVNVLWHHGEDDYGLWQVQLPVYLVRNILNSPQSFIGDVDEVMNGVSMEPEPTGNRLHFLFPRGGLIACCSMEMKEDFFVKYSTHGASVRGSRGDIRADLIETLELDETLQEER